MVDCPNGTEIRPEWVALDTVWSTAEDICERIELILALFRMDCKMFIPKLVEIDALCATLPRPLPEVDWEGLARSGAPLISYGPVLDWWQAWWENEKWSSYCQCSATTGPGPCPPIPLQSGGWTNNWPTFLPLGPEVTAPHGFTGGTVRFSLSSSYGGSHDLVVRFYNASHVQVREIGPNDVTAATSPKDWTWSTTGWPAGTADSVRYARGFARAQTGSNVVGSGSWEMLSWTGTCQDVDVIPPPPAPLPDEPLPDVPPMPPLPASCTIDTVCSMLQQLLPAVTNTSQMVNLLRRYLLPLGTIPGTQHLSLTASGSWEISDLVGMQVVIEGDLPPRQLEGAPPYIWDLGWMSIMTDEGMILEQRITREVQTWQPRLMQQASTFGYFLKPGVTASFQELHPME